MRSFEKLMSIVFVLTSLLTATGIVRASNVPPGQTESPDKISKTQTTPTRKSANDNQTNPPDPGESVGSGLQIVRGPDDIVTSGECATRTTAIIVRATKNIKGVRIAGGALTDADSKAILPSGAFELLGRRAGQNTCENEYEPYPGNAVIPKDTLATLYLRLRKTWKQPGNFAGDLLLAPEQSSGAESLRFKVSLRPRVAWLWGLLAILAGTVLSWFATIWWPRRRQMTVNKIFIARLDDLLVQLQTKLKQMSQGGVSWVNQTLDHIDLIRRKRLRQLLEDMILTLLTGNAPNQAGSVGVSEEIGGVTRVVSAGFAPLFDLWQRYPGQQTVLKDFFLKMDALGARVESKDTLEPDIKKIVDSAHAAIESALEAEGRSKDFKKSPIPEFIQKDAVVQGVIRTTAWLDAASIAAIVLAGAYTLIWKNSGFGNAGDLLVAFFWGLGLKIGADSARIAGGDVRTAMGIKIPSI